MDKRPQTVVGHGIEFVARTEYRRLIVVIGIPVVFLALLVARNNLGLSGLLFVVGLVGFLYTRPTAQQTIAASAYATGMLMIGLFLLELYYNGARGSTEPLIGTATRVFWLAVTGTVLTGLGLWIRQADF